MEPLALDLDGFSPGQRRRVERLLEQAAYALKGWSDPTRIP